jgi:5-amino-6-(5-phosphoribosylamino)uracil reductase
MVTGRFTSGEARVTERPYVLLSAAMSADGYIDDASSTRLVLSDEADLDRVDELRAASDAILVGAQTIRADDPRLLVRSSARRQRRLELGRAASPRRVTITRSGALDPGARFFAAAPDRPLVQPDLPLPQPDRPLEFPDRAVYPDRPLVYAAPAVAGDLAARLSTAAVVVPVPLPGVTEDAPESDLSWILADLARRGIARLMVEGGARVLAQFLSAGLADEFLLAIAPVLVADARAPRLLAGASPAGRMALTGVTMAGDMAVLHYLPRPAQSGRSPESTRPAKPAD